jgi:hypothetical protein
LSGSGVTGSTEENMSEAYRAVLRGDHVEWTGDKPSPSQTALVVEVTVLGAAEESEHRSNGPAMAAALEAIARAGTFTPGGDPLAWERAERADRPLPGRDEE